VYIYYGNIQSNRIRIALKYQILNSHYNLQYLSVYLQIFPWLVCQEIAENCERKGLYNLYKFWIPFSWLSVLVLIKVFQKILFCRHWNEHFRLISSSNRIKISSTESKNVTILKIQISHYSSMSYKNMLIDCLVSTFLSSWQNLRTKECVHLQTPNNLIDKIWKRLFYIEYEIAFGKIAENGTLRYEDILKYFAECGHHPSEKEVDDAIAMVTKGIYVL
jgi:L-lactate permease